MTPLVLRAALRRGLVIVLANWPIVLIDLAISLFTTATLFVPVAGGVLMVASLVGTDLVSQFPEGLLSVVESVLIALASAPEALVAFLLATALVAVGADIARLVIKGGTLGIVVVADRAAGELGRRAIGELELVSARAFSIERVIEGTRRFARPMVHLSIVRAALYGLLAAVYLALVAAAVRAGSSGTFPAAWSALLLVATSTGIVLVAAINLLCDLLRIVVVTDDVGLGAAWRRVRQFVVEDARQVIGIVSVIAGIEIVAWSVAILATAGIAPVAYLPVVSLAVLPLQIAFWIVRSLLVELAALTSVAACQTQYRRFSSGRTFRATSAE